MTVSLYLRPKGRSFTETHDKNRGNQIFCPLDTRSLNWSVFNDINSVLDLSAIAESLIPKKSSRQDPIWDNGARDILVGLLAYAYERKKTSNQELWSIFQAEASLMLDYLNCTELGQLGARHLSDPHSRMASSFLSTFSQYIGPFQFLSDGDFSISEWVFDEKNEGFLFMLNQEQVSAAVRPMLTLFLDRLSSSVLSLDDDHNRRIYLLLDEFTELGRMPSIPRLLKLGRSKGAAIDLAIQELGQLFQIYGTDESKTILGNLRNFVIFGVDDQDTRRYFSSLLGEREYWEREQTLSTGVMDSRDGISVYQKKNRDALVLPSQLGELLSMEGYLQLKGYHPVRLFFDGMNHSSDSDRFLLKEGLSLEALLASQMQEEENKIREKSPSIAQETESLLDPTTGDEIERKEMDIGW